MHNFNTAFNIFSFQRSVELDAVIEFFLKMADTIVVLGMHRSGTSSVAGVLSLLGATPPNTPMPVSGDNERGYFESVPLHHFHDALLTTVGSSWCDWHAFDSSWYNAPGYETSKCQAKELYKQEFNEASLAVLKDPRICRFFPFWNDVLTELGRQPHIIIPVRSPLEVACSLKRRDGFSLTRGLLLWLRHVLDAEFATRALPRAIFSWNEFLSDWRETVDKISMKTGIVWPRLSYRSANRIDKFLTLDLKHHRIEDKALALHRDVHEWVLRTYDCLLKLADSYELPSVYTELDVMRWTFDNSYRLFVCSELSDWSLVHFPGT